MKLTSKIGVIQITDTHVRAVVVKTGSLPPTVLDHAEMPFPPAGEDAEVNHAERITVIQRVVDELKQQPTLWTYCAPQAWSVMRLLTVPFKGSRKVRAALTFELEPYLAIPIEELLIDYIPIRELDNKTEVLVIGLKRGPVLEQLAQLKEAGLEIESIGLDIVGLSALTYETELATTAPSAMLLQHLGATHLAVVHNKSLAYVQRIAASPERMESYGQEVQNALRAFQASTAEIVEIGELTCCDSRVDDVEQAHLMELVELPVSAKKPGAAWMPPEMMKGENASQWLSMVGSASAGAGGAFSVSFDIDEEEVLASTAPYRKQVAVLGFLVVAAFVGFLGVKHLQTTRNMAEVERIGAAVHVEFQATFPNHPDAKERPAGDTGGSKSIASMQEAADDEARTATALTPAIFNTPSLPNVLREIGQHMPDNLASIETISMQERRRFWEIRINGTTKNPGAFAKMTDGLNNSSLLEFTKEPERQSINNEERFQIILTFRNSNPDS